MTAELKIKELVQMGAYDKFLDTIRSQQSNDNENIKLESIIDKDGCTLLHWAAINNRVRIANYLLSYGNGNINFSGGILQEIPLQWAVRNDKFNTMVHMLIRCGSHVNFKNRYGHTALHIAVAHGNIHNAFILLRNGADVNTTDVNGYSPLMYIIKDKPEHMTVEVHRQVVQLLISFSADVLLADKLGNTPLHAMASFLEESFDPYIALQLIQHGGYSSRRTVSHALEARNISGMTPFMIARDNRSLAMIRFLFDEYMFRLFPREFPAAVMALLVPLMFLSIYQWGIIIGLLVDVALVFGSTRLRQDSIVKALSRIQIGVAVGIILTLLWSYYTFITEFMSNTYDTIVLIISPLIFITLYLASYTQADSLLPRVKRSRLYQKIVRAGYKEGMTELESSNTIGDDLYKNIWALKKTQSSSIQAIETITDHLALNLDINSDDDDDDDNACSESLLQPATKQPTRLCASCLCDKSEGSTHCFKCDICVVDLDHHCAFVSNCVGKGNRRAFVLFTLFASIGCGLHLFGALYAVLSPTRYQFINGSADLCFVTSMLLSLLMTVWIGSIAGAQLAHVSQETTSYEVLKGRNHGGCCRCDIRGQSNLFQFFKSGKFRVSSGAYCTHGNTPHTCTSSSGSAHENGSLSRFEGRKSPAVDDKSSSAHKDHTGSWDFLFGKHSSSSGINHRHSNSPS